MKAKLDTIRDEIIELTKKYYTYKFGDKSNFKPGESSVKYAGRVFDENELVNLVDSSLDFWLTAGRFAEEFEYKFAEYFNADDAILVNSGSSANLVAVSTLTSHLLGDRRLKPNDEVITVATGFPTTIAPIVQNQLIPVFIDVEIPTYNIDCSMIEEAISKKTKAIFIAHTLGNPWNTEKVVEIAKKHNLWIIEDNCDALGSRYNGNLTGTYGHISTFSFYPAHHITMGEGGCVVTHDEMLSRIARSFRDWGRDCYCGPGENNTCGLRFSKQYGDLPVGYDHKYVYSHLGYNLKVTDMQAAIGLAQFQKLDFFTKKRKENFKFLYDGLKKFEKQLILPEATPNSNPSWFSFIISVREDAGFTKTEIINYLESKKIETRHIFSGNIIKQPGFINIKQRTHGILKNTDFIMNNTFFIGVYPGLDENQLEYIIDEIEKFINKL